MPAKEGRSAALSAAPADRRRRGAPFAVPCLREAIGAHRSVSAGGLDPSEPALSRLGALSGAPLLHPSPGPPRLMPTYHFGKSTRLAASSRKSGRIASKGRQSPPGCSGRTPQRPPRQWGSRTGRRAAAKRKEGPRHCCSLLPSKAGLRSSQKKRSQCSRRWGSAASWPFPPGRPRCAAAPRAPSLAVPQADVCSSAVMQIVGSAKLCTVSVSCTSSRWLDGCASRSFGAATRPRRRRRPPLFPEARS